MELFELIRTLTRAYGPSGDEAEIRQVVEELIRPCADEVYTDVLGNLIAHKRGSGPKVLFSAHLDSIGLMVTHIEKDGTLRVGKVGGVSPYAAAYAPVRFKNGTTCLGGGAAVKIMDHSVVCHPDVVAKLEQAAAAQSIKVQRDIMRAGGTDAGAIHLTRSGVPTGGISVPCRYVHTPVEAASLKDIEECVRLTVAFAQAELA